MDIPILGKDYKTKFNISDKVYRAGVVVLDSLCSKCNGNGYYRKDKESDELETCCYCDGNGTKTVYRRTINDNPLTIKSINLNIDEEKITTRYSIEQNTPSGMVVELSYVGEEELFGTIEEMEQYCKDRNTIKKTMKLADIIIQLSYLQAYPSSSKIKERMDELKEHGKFTNMVEVDVNNVLVDGYTTYVLAKGFGFEEIEVIVREDICV